MAEEERSPASSRELRRRKKEGLRSKSTGVGLSIDIAESTGKTNKKIVFDEDPNFEDLPADSDKEDREAVEAHVGDDSDDDAVEEVKGTIAKEQAHEQRIAEREVAKVSTDLKASKRKRKSRLEKKVAEDKEDFDEDFFDQLDAEMEEQRENKKKDRKGSDDSEKPKGRHTTFVADEKASVPVKVGENIEVVVLQSDPVREGTTSMPVSKAAVLFSRGQLVDGCDMVSEKQIRKAKKAGQDVLQRTSTWKRSKKMNRLLLPGAQNKRRKGEGVAASHFVVKM